MIYFILAGASFLTSLLTLFSGFGLGTLLMPVFALFFPLPLAIGLTAIVHLTNNLFKFFLLGKFADKKIVIQFGLPAIAASFLGAWCLRWFSLLPPVYHYTLGAKTAEITALNLLLAILMAAFGVFEILPFFQRLALDKKYLGAGGLLSGFFGGLSGHQGALRSAFLVRCGLTKEAFIGTGVVIACLVDIARLTVYGSSFKEIGLQHLPLVCIAVLAALSGAWLGQRHLTKVTIEGIRILVALLLFLIALMLGLGLI